MILSSIKIYLNKNLQKFFLKKYMEIKKVKVSKFIISSESFCFISLAKLLPMRLNINEVIII